VSRELATQFLELAQKRKATVPLLVGHRLMGTSLSMAGEFARCRDHYDQALALYDHSQHRPLAMRFGQDVGVTVLSYRSQALWMLGYPQAALADTDHALRDAREIGQAGTLMFALFSASLTQIICRDYAAAEPLIGELVALADKTGALFWKAWGTLCQGCLRSLTGQALEAVRTLTSAITALRSAGSTMTMSANLSFLAKASADVGNFDDAWRRIGEAMTVVGTTKEKFWEAEINRTAGEIALMSPEPDAPRAEEYFERALVIARHQQAKSCELRAAMSLARLWRDQGKPQQARELLAPVYGWFTEGFDTRDLKEAKALLEELAAEDRPL
jgi:predicted ATPase